MKNMSFNLMEIRLMKPVALMLALLMGSFQVPSMVFADPDATGTETAAVSEKQVQFDANGNVVGSEPVAEVVSLDGVSDNSLIDASGVPSGDKALEQVDAVSGDAPVEKTLNLMIDEGEPMWRSEKPELAVCYAYPYDSNPEDGNNEQPFKMTISDPTLSYDDILVTADGAGMEGGYYGGDYTKPRVTTDESSDPNMVMEVQPRVVICYGYPYQPEGEGGPNETPIDVTIGSIFEYPSEEDIAKVEDDITAAVTNLDVITQQIEADQAVGIGLNEKFQLGINQFETEIESLEGRRSDAEIALKSSEEAADLGERDWQAKFANFNNVQADLQVKADEIEMHIAGLEEQNNQANHEFEILMAGHEANKEKILAEHRRAEEEAARLKKVIEEANGDFSNKSLVLADQLEDANADIAKEQADGTKLTAQLDNEQNQADAAKAAWDAAQLAVDGAVQAEDEAEVQYNTSLEAQNAAKAALDIATKDYRDFMRKLSRIPARERAARTAQEKRALQDAQNVYSAARKIVPNLKKIWSRAINALAAAEKKEDALEAKFHKEEGDVARIQDAIQLNEVEVAAATKHAEELEVEIEGLNAGHESQIVSLNGQLDSSVTVVSGLDSDLEALEKTIINDRAGHEAAQQQFVLMLNQQHDLMADIHAQGDQIAGDIQNSRREYEAQKDAWQAAIHMAQEHADEVLADVNALNQRKLAFEEDHRRQLQEHADLMAKRAQQKAELAANINHLQDEYFRMMDEAELGKQLAFEAEQARLEEEERLAEEEEARLAEEEEARLAAEEEARLAQEEQDGTDDDGMFGIPEDQDGDGMIDDRFIGNDPYVDQPDTTAPEDPRRIDQEGIKPDDQTTMTVADEWYPGEEDGIQPDTTAPEDLRRIDQEGIKPVDQIRMTVADQWYPGDEDVTKPADQTAMTVGLELPVDDGGGVTDTAKVADGTETDATGVVADPDSTEAIKAKLELTGYGSLVDEVDSFDGDGDGEISPSEWQPLFEMIAKMDEANTIVDGTVVNTDSGSTMPGTVEVKMEENAGPTATDEPVTSDVSTGTMEVKAEAEVKPADTPSYNVIKNPDGSYTVTFADGSPVPYPVNVYENADGTFTVERAEENTGAPASTGSTLTTTVETSATTEGMMGGTPQTASSFKFDDGTVISVDLATGHLNVGGTEFESHMFLPDGAVWFAAPESMGYQKIGHATDSNGVAGTLYGKPVQPKIEVRAFDSYDFNNDGEKNKLDYQFVLNQSQEGIFYDANRDGQGNAADLTAIELALAGPDSGTGSDATADPNLGIDTATADASTDTASPTKKWALNDVIEGCTSNEVCAGASASWELTDASGMVVQSGSLSYAEENGRFVGKSGEYDLLPGTYIVRVKTTVDGQVYESKRTVQV